MGCRQCRAFFAARKRQDSGQFGAFKGFWPGFRVKRHDHHMHSARRNCPLFVRVHAGPHAAGAVTPGRRDASHLARDGLDQDRRRTCRTKDGKGPCRSPPGTKSIPATTPRRRSATSDASPTTIGSSTPRSSSTIRIRARSARRIRTATIPAAASTTSAGSSSTPATAVTPRSCSSSRRATSRTTRSSTMRRARTRRRTSSGNRRRRSRRAAGRSRCGFRSRRFATGTAIPRPGRSCCTATIRATATTSSSRRKCRAATTASSVTPTRSRACSDCRRAVTSLWRRT